MALVRGLACATALVAPAAASTPGSTPDDELSDAAIGLAKRGIVEFVAEHEANPFEIADPCPIASEEAIGTLMEEHGYTPNVAGWATNLEWELDHSTIECGPSLVEPDRPDSDAPHSAFVVAMELDSEELRFRDLVDEHGATMVAKDVPAIGGEVAVVCGGQGVGLCIADWHRDGLVISLGIWGPADDVAEDRTIEMLTVLVPAAVESLAETLSGRPQSARRGP